MALYFAAAIKDDVLVGNNSTQIWGDDVIELAIRVPADSQTHQFTLAVDGRKTDNGNPITSLTVRHPHRPRRLDPRSRASRPRPSVSGQLAGQPILPLHLRPLG